MLTFPDIQPPSYDGLEENHIDNTDAMEFEDKTIGTRRNVTGHQLEWKLTWDAMPSDDYDKLVKFFDNETYGRALPFQWTYPADPGNSNSEKIFTVRFKTKIIGTMSGLKKWKVSFELEEV